MLLDRVYPSPPNSRTGYENLRETPIIYKATLGYAARQGIPPSSQFYNRGTKI